MTRAFLFLLGVSAYGQAVQAFDNMDVVRIAKTAYACGRIVGSREILEKLNPGNAALAEYTKLYDKAGCADVQKLFDVADGKDVAQAAQEHSDVGAAASFAIGGLMVGQGAPGPEFSPQGQERGERDAFTRVDLALVVHADSTAIPATQDLHILRRRVQVLPDDPPVELSRKGYLAGHSRNGAAAFRLSQAALLGAQIADSASSWHQPELNPLLRSSTGDFGGKGLAIKFGITGGLLLAQEWMVRWWPSTAKVWMWVNFGGAAVTTGVAVRNWRLE